MKDDNLFGGIRALRVYKGPSNPSPFMGLINSLSFQCWNMDRIVGAPGAVYSLTRMTDNGGKVIVKRVNMNAPVDYVWTFSEQKNYLVLNSTYEPSQYVYDLEGAFCWKIDPRIEGNYTDWYSAAIEVYGTSMTSVMHGDVLGFDMMVRNQPLWGDIFITQRFSYNGAYLFSLALPYSQDDDDYKAGCEETATLLPNVVSAYSYYRKAHSNQYKWFRYQSDLVIHHLEENGSLSVRAVLSLSGYFGETSETSFSWHWASLSLDEDCFYVTSYGNKERYLDAARWFQLYKIDYNGNILAQTALEQFPTNAGHDEPNDTYTGWIKHNKKYVVHYSPYGQYIRVWDKDLNFIKYIDVDPRWGRYGYIIADYRNEIWCNCLGFIEDKIYLINGKFAQPGEEPNKPGGYHGIPIYDVSSDAGAEFIREMKLYPQAVATTGITLEGYRR